MPTIKNITGTSGAAEQRLIIYDEYLSGASIQRPVSKEVLLRNVNKKINTTIGASQFNKDIASLRDKLEAYSKGGNINVCLINKKPEGYYYSQPGFKLFKNQIDESDKNLLLYASSLFHVFKGTSLYTRFNDLIKRLIDNSLTTESGNFPNNIVQISNDNDSRSKRWLSKIANSITEKACLEVVYKNSKGVTSKKQLCPYVIKIYKNKWYVIAYDHTSSRENKTNVFALENILSIDYGTKDYFVDSHFDVEKYFNYSLGIWHNYQQNPVCVQLEFLDKNSFHSIINNPFHHSQTHTFNKDRLTITIEVYDCPELYSLIYSFGATVKVISPQSVVDKVRDNILRTLDLYE